MSTGTTTSRRVKVRAAQLNGVDSVEVSDDGLLLTVMFLGKAPHGLGPENVRIDGGRRITGLTDITAVDVSIEREEDPELDDRLYVTLDRAGDTSEYVFSLVETDPYGRPGTEPFRGFDQRYHRAFFSFRPDCPTPFDCKEDEPEPAGFLPRPSSTTRPATTTPSASCSWTGSRSPPRTGSSATPPTWASRSSSCSRTPAIRSATSRTRWPPRPTWTPRAAGSLYGGTSGSSTTP